MSKCSSRVGACVVVVCLGAVLGAESANDAITLVVPLDSVWALNMPGTKDVLKIDNGAYRGLVGEMRRSLHQPNGKSGTAGKVIVVSGQGAMALKEAGKELIEGRSGRGRVRETEEISVLFYSRLFALDVRLESIEIRNQRIRIVYGLNEHEEAYVDEHFGLIPLGKLPAGKYEVLIEPSLTARELVSRGFKAPAETMAKVVCESSTFDVTR